MLRVSVCEARPRRARLSMFGVCARGLPKAPTESARCWSVIKRRKFGRSMPPPFCSIAPPIRRRPGSGPAMAMDCNERGVTIRTHPHDHHDREAAGHAIEGGSRRVHRDRPPPAEVSHTGRGGTPEKAGGETVSLTSTAVPVTPHVVLLLRRGWFGETPPRSSCSAQRLSRRCRGSWRSRGIVAHPSRRALGEDLPGLEAVHAVGDAHDERHVVLDEEHRRAQLRHTLTQRIAAPRPRSHAGPDRPWARPGRARGPRGPRGPPARRCGACRWRGRHVVVSRSGSGRGSRPGRTPRPWTPWCGAGRMAIARARSTSMPG